MPVPSPHTFVAGETEVASFLNSLGSCFNYLIGTTLGRHPLCVMRQSAAQSIPNNTDTVVSFNAEDIDTDNGHDTSVNNSRYTAQTAGWYEVAYNVGFAQPGSPAGTRLAYLVQNGVTTIGAFTLVLPSHNGETWLAGTRPVYLAVGEYVEVRVHHTQGAALNVGSVFAKPRMTVRWIHQ